MKIIHKPLWLILAAACHGDVVAPAPPQPPPPPQDDGVRAVASWSLLSDDDGDAPSGTIDCPSRQWYDDDAPDPLPVSCDPVAYTPGFRLALSDADSALTEHLNDRGYVYSIRRGWRYPARGCTAKPTLQGLDLVAPGYGGRIRAWCGSRYLASTGARLIVYSRAPDANETTLRDLARVSVEPGTEQLDVSLPHAELFQTSQPDADVMLDAIAMLADGAPVSIRGGGGIRYVVDGRVRYSDGMRVEVLGDCGELNIDLQPARSLKAEGSFPRFDVDVGWGLGSIELFPGTVLHSSSRLQAGGTGRLILPSSVAARIDYPEGWTIICYEVDNPACWTWGPGSLYTQPDAKPVIELAGPRGYVVLVADPWPPDVDCPVDPTIRYPSTELWWPLHPEDVAQGLRDPDCYEDRTFNSGIPANTDILRPPGIDFVSRPSVWAPCRRRKVPQDRAQPVDRGPWPGPHPWGSPRQER